MKYYIGIALIIVSIFCGCASQNIAKKGAAPQEQELTQVRPARILYGESSQNYNTKKQWQINRQESEQSNSHIATDANTTPVNPIPQITFTAVESANVRVAGNNPLPASGELVLDLSQLKEDFCYPYRGKIISSYGIRGKSMHTGVDIKAIPGDTIRAAMSGVVRMSKNYSSYGNIIVIRHGCGVETLYSHQLRNLVQPNDIVTKGQAIGLAGRTGRSTTEHLHFELRVAGEHIDPSKFLDYNNMSIRSGSLSLKYMGGKIYASNTDSDANSNTASRAVSGTAVNNNRTTTQRESVRQSQTTTSSSTSGQTYHTVKRGDTLYSIARKYGTSVDAICKINNIDKDGVLRLEQRLKLK